MVKVGEISAEHRIYSCTKCRNHKAFLVGEMALACEVCAEKNRKQEWKPTKKEFIILSRNVAKEIDGKKDWLDKLADQLNARFGTPEFLFFHLIWFSLWILMNTGTIPGIIFDPYPFGFLTLVVSLEAIFLAIFILISQNRAAEVSEKRAELDYQVDVKAERRIAEMLALLRDHLDSKR